ncbi:uncharacterized protein EV420DRAFT_1591134 [Desarmillaria tabescens]|uniref:Uncharacterized protein n=1 Tax=Armillaria tabescens TaxID=1929756 RepID=A0AA39J756_ARMTA|nr:uncharacterized protein EV420DRAFT_1591134 [Desarmillaria tabescens]KAK0436059.1 hypothetical protein EV420DRAFT_1591134 [Desarmillaria tabescens]
METLKSGGETYSTPEALALAWKQRLAAVKIKWKLEIATRDLVAVLNQKVVPPRYDRPLEFFIYLDKAHTLTEGKLTQAIGSPPSCALDIFNTVLGWLVGFPFFTIYISTTNLEPAAMPSISYGPVSRQEPLNAHTPFTELPFDVFAHDVMGYLGALGGGRIFLEDTHSEQYLRKFRWNSHCLENYPNKYWIQDELSARQTIRGRKDLLYACVGLTVQFDFDHGQSMIAKYPSEPLLIKTASQLFPGGQLKTYIPHALNKADSEAHGHPVPVLVFLNHMFNQKWQDSILSIRPVGDEHGPPLHEAFKDVYVNFTHFAAAGDSKVIQYLPHVMLQFLMYGCCSMNSVDLITVMHHDSLQNPLCDSSMSQLAFQIQNYCYAGSKGPSCAVVAYAVGDRG